MKYFTFLAFSSLFISMISCGHGRPVDETGTSETTTSFTPSGSTTKPQTIPMDLTSTSTPATPSMITPTGTTAAGLNPPHGQPGHRCDIAVGAPLNSKPAPQNANAVATPVNIPNNQPTPPVATTSIAQGMNPAHGQPGHRCDIAVGAPLNSKPDQQPVSMPTTTSDQPAKPATATVVAPGMNPAHGQPGHRCDIAVGAPLDSKPIVVAGTPSANTVTSSQSIPAIIPIKPAPDTKKDNR